MYKCPLVKRMKIPSWGIFIKLFFRNYFRRKISSFRVKEPQNVIRKKKKQIGNEPQENKVLVSFWKCKYSRSWNLLTFQNTSFIDSLNWQATFVLQNEFLETGINLIDLFNSFLNYLRANFTNQTPTAKWAQVRDKKVAWNLKHK